MTTERYLHGWVGDVDPELKAMLENEPIRYRPRQFVPRDEFVAAFDGLPSFDYDEWRADIDAHVDPSPWSWDDWEARANRHINRDSADFG